MRTPRLVVSAVLLASLAVAAPSFAKGGTGGGGGGTGGGTVTVKNGAIRPVSGAATCDGSSAFAITLRKGFDSRVELQFAPSGPELGDGYWTVRTRVLELDKSLGGMGGTLTSGSLVTTLQAGVPQGAWTIRVTAQRSSGTNLISDPTAPILESCAADFAVVAR